jgi:hypothetical protein
MELLRRGAGGARGVALLAGAWNPPTRAHVALAEAAREFAPEVLLTLPGVLPHKEFEEPGFDTRLGWLLQLAAGREWLGVAAGGSGLLWSWRGGCGRPIQAWNRSSSFAAATRLSDS